MSKGPASAEPSAPAAYSIVRRFPSKDRFAAALASLSTGFFSMRRAAPNSLVSIRAIRDRAYDQVSHTHAGWTVGGGIEYAVTDNWSVRAEYRYTDFGHLTDITPFVFGIGSTVTHHETENAVRAGFSYKFDGFGAASLCEILRSRSRPKALRRMFV